MKKKSRRNFIKKTSVLGAGFFIVPRNVLGGVGAGTSSSLAFGGTPPVGGQTEEWSGSSIATNVLTD